MTQSINPLNPRPPRPWLPVVLVIVIAPVLVMALLAVGVIRTFGLSSDAAALRRVAQKSPGSGWHRKIEVGVGPMTAGLARTVLAFVHIDPEARTALSAFREGSVGVYHREQPSRLSNYATTLAGVDMTMEARGWERVVGVSNPEELVAVYVPRKSLSPRNTQVCVLVVNREDMVVASVRGNLEPLLALAREHIGRDHKLWAAVRF